MIGRGLRRVIDLRDGPAVAFVGEDGDAIVRSEPEDLSAGFGWRCGRVGVETALEESAMFFEVAFGGAVNKFKGLAELAVDEDVAAGFFEELAMEGLLGRFAGVCAAAGEADAVIGLDDGDLAAIILNHGIGAGADDVASAFDASTVMGLWLGLVDACFVGFPLGFAQAIEDVAANGMISGDFGMIEIIRRVPRHAEALHQRPGGLIDWGGEGDYLREVKRLESEAKGSAGGLGRVAAALEFVAHAPADFDAGGEMRLE